MNDSDIFPFFRNGKEVFGDPLALQDELEVRLGDLNDILNQTHSPDPVTYLEATGKLARAVCRTFKLGDPWNEETGTGVQRKEWLAILNSFVEWLEKNAVPAEPSATESQPSELVTSAGH